MIERHLEPGAPVPDDGTFKRYQPSQPWATPDLAALEIDPDVNVTQTMQSLHMEIQEPDDWEETRLSERTAEWPIDPTADTGFPKGDRDEATEAAPAGDDTKDVHPGSDDPTGGDKKVVGRKGERYDFVGDVRGLGAMCGIEFVDPGSGRPDPARAARVCQAALERGLLLMTASGNVIRTLMPLTISDETLERALDLLEHSLEQVAQA